MPEAQKPSFGKRLMALGCAICPFCVAARKWPNSAFARTLRKMEKTCPFCRAYNDLRGNATGEPTPTDPPDQDQPPAEEHAS